MQGTTTFICWRLTHVNDCVLTWPTLKETAHMLSTTISRWPQLRTNTDSFLLEHTMEPQVGTVMENFGRKCFKLWSELSCLNSSANQQTTRYDWREMSYNLRSARPKFRPRGLDRMASFNISGFRAIKNGVCWYLQGMSRLRPLHLPYDMIRDAILTCARKPTWVSLIYRTEPTSKKWKKQKKTKKQKNRYAQKCMVIIQY